MDKLTPKKIVKELDKYIIGQDKAKKAVAIALRNRWRRQNVSAELREEILPNNIILIGPTGVGKTEISRRLARLVEAPFMKVEATKFTEVGYVGQEVGSIIRELVNISLNQVKKKMMRDVETQAHKMVEERILDALLPSEKAKIPSNISREERQEKRKEIAAKEEKHARTREKLRKLLQEGKLEERQIEVKVDKGSDRKVEVFSNLNLDSFDIDMGEMLSGMMPHSSQKRKRMKVKEAREFLFYLESQKLIDMNEAKSLAVKQVEQNGIVFLDEIDKIAGEESKSNPGVSRQGVQRDLLPIIEGTKIPTKYGMVDTTHILFIASGAFHISKPSDLIPEIQGRFPIRVELNSLDEGHFSKILRLPKNALIKQYKEMLKTEGVRLSFTKGAIKAIASYSAQANARMEDIGARRLHTILTLLLEEYLYKLPDYGSKKIRIKKSDVANVLSEVIKDEDLTKYIL